MDNDMKIEVHGKVSECMGGIEMSNTNKRSFQLSSALASMTKGSTDFKESVHDLLNKRPVDTSWLPACASVYDISSDIRDYIVSAIPIITSNIPNRNLQCMTTEELFRFHPTFGRVAYKTFVGKPTHKNHQNKDLLQAKGVNFDAIAVKIPKYSLYKIVVLSGFDRTKDPELAQAILKKDIRSFSMGSWITAFMCAVCGVRLMGVECACQKLYGKEKVTTNGQLIYSNLMGIDFFENSALDIPPADYTARSDVLFDLS